MNTFPAMPYASVGFAAPAQPRPVVEDAAARSWAELKSQVA